MTPEREAEMDREFEAMRKRARAWAHGPGPSFPLWLLIKLLWLTLRGKKIARVQLHPPYTITYKN